MLKEILHKGQSSTSALWLQPQETAIRNGAVSLFFLPEKHKKTDVYRGCESFFMEMMLKN